VRIVSRRRGLLEQGPRRREKVGPSFSGSRVLISRTHTNAMVTKTTTTTTTTTTTIDTSGQTKPGSPTRLCAPTAAAAKSIFGYIPRVNGYGIRLYTRHYSLLLLPPILLLLARYHFRACVRYIILYGRMYNEIKIYIPDRIHKHIIIIVIIFISL